jgi:hypothetical protein
MLAHAEATRNMPPRKFIGALGLLILGGNGTTRNSMSGSVGDRLAEQQLRILWDRDPATEISFRDCW